MSSIIRSSLWYCSSMIKAVGCRVSYHLSKAYDTLKMSFLLLYTPIFSLHPKKIIIIISNQIDDHWIFFHWPLFLIWTQNSLALHCFSFEPEICSLRWFFKLRSNFLLIITSLSAVALKIKLCAGYYHKQDCNFFFG